ncbi:hybrid-cluster NAD(P)-dependent oxidoreductase [Vibrio vulnificus]|uniref:hybrid-cluster NAD(P)-dependent oxidoreductase n=1 Tax=Vibrio sp. CCUG 15886 TaxID=3025223 RepID=UPI00235980BD|nr:hybrid-cluster NAD(P)-dependent oxidoreductase [Vibrio sp. CCUG 15886]EIO3978366.1 hybrid-cluster NAD(P)-dependent oxidoreductase [Vibrio vulnificus]MDC8109318.1 hybrid-cluster NAD(P)-dependent oxidoreductase [Vibrio sp. CCUG 15886]
MFFEWQGNEPATLQCVDKFFETDDTVSIRLADLTESLLFQFKPGQFVNLGVEIDGKMEFRAYSISSLAGKEYLQFTIKRVEGGKVSNFIIDSLLIGDTVQALAPAGEFNCVDHPPRELNGQGKALLISAGCGVTPVFAMAKHWLSNEMNVDIEFLHIARSAQETIYFDHLSTCQSAYAHFHLKLLLKDAQGTTHPQGRFNAQWLQDLVPDFATRTIYLCGPNQFMQDTQDYLQALGFDMNHFYHESFTPEKVEAMEASDEEVCISVPDFAQTINAKKGQLLADVLENAGLPLIVACRSGICGSCKCKVANGQVRSISQETLTAEEIAQGYVLACSSHIESDLDVSLH